MSKVQCSHILVKHSGSRRPASWKDPEGKEITKRSKADARSILAGYRQSIVSGDKQFAELAKVASDCSSAAQGGDLGAFGRGEMQKPFEDVSFALKVGELSDIVETESGVHIILRTK